MHFCNPLYLSNPIFSGWENHISRKSKWTLRFLWFCKNVTAQTHLYPGLRGSKSIFKNVTVDYVIIKGRWKKKEKESWRGKMCESLFLIQESFKIILSINIWVTKFLVIQLISKQQIGVRMIRNCCSYIQVNCSLGNVKLIIWIWKFQIFN